MGVECSLPEHLRKCRDENKQSHNNANPELEDNSHKAPLGSAPADLEGMNGFAAPKQFKAGSADE
jgi:mannose-6-phosphate isomerase class I